MKKKLRFNPAFIWIFILLCSLLASFLVVNIDTDFFGEDREYSFIKRSFKDASGESFNTSENQYNREGNIIKYIVNLKVIDNYYFTKEYKKQNPDIIVVQEEGGSIVKFTDKKEYDEYIQNGYKQGYEVIKDNQKSIEDKKYSIVINNNFNDRIIKEDFKPSLDFKVEDKGVTWIKGSYKDGNYTLKSNKDELGDVKNIKYFDFLESEIKNQLDNIKEIYNKKDDGESFYRDIIEEADFYYQVDLDSSIIKSFPKSQAYLQNYLVRLFAAMCIVSLIALLLTTFTNYKEAKNQKTFTALTNIPVEIFMLVCFFIIFIPGLGIYKFNIYDYIWNNTLELFKNPIYYYLLAFVVSILFMTVVIYIVQVLKSIYHEGTKSFLFEKSIIIRIINILWSIIRKMFRYLERILFNLFGNYGPTTKIFVIGIYLFFCFFIFIFSSVFYRRSLVFFTGIFMLTSIFFLFSKYYIDLKEIEDTARRISQGDYKKKIDETKNLYKKLSRYLNLTGDSLSLAMGKELKSERLKTELITNVSHDLKTPLTSIINYSQLASDKDASQEEVKKYNKIILDKSLRLKELIENLFEVSKATSNNIELNITDINFSEMVNQMAGEWTDKLKEKDICIVSSIEEDIHLQLDGQQTYRILDNVFSNIYKYAQENTRVYIDMINHGKCFLTIKNISKYELNISADELMERFTRGDASRSTEGSGLGLSIASTLTKVQGGEFKIEILGDLFMVIISF